MVGRGAALALWALAAGCGNPCTHLADRVCADLGPADCDLWLNREAVSGDLLSWHDRRASTAVPVCEMWLSEPNYHRATLPLVRWRVANERTPGRAGPAPSIGALEPPGDPLGIPGWAYWLVAPIALLGVTAYWLVTMRRIKSAATRTERWLPPE